MKHSLHPYLRIVVNSNSSCNLRCPWCHDEGNINNHEILILDKIIYACSIFRQLGIMKFKLVGGEPTLRDGTEIEFKHCQMGKLLLLNACHHCQVRNLCQEGIFALRLMPSGLLQPCIVRTDNTFDIRVEPSVQELSNYLAAL